MAKTPTVKEMQAALASRQYKDAPTSRLEDWRWNPLADVQKKLAMEREIPDYIQKGYGGFMNEQLAKAKAGQLSPRDLIKAYAITQSSIGRGGLSHGTATKAGMKLPNTGGEVRPEGAFAEWLGSPMGQRYMDAAERGELHQPALEDLRAKFAPFGKQNEQVNAMIYAAQTLPGKAAGINQAISGPTNEFRDYAEGLKGIAGAKSGFIGSLLGRGDLPTLDARQLNLHAGKAPVGIGAIMKRGKGQGAREAVDRLAARQRAMGFAVDPSMEPHYQHLAHHAVWDKAADTQTTHEDLVKALRGYADGGDVEAMRQQLAASQPAGHLEHLPRRPNPAVGSRYDVRAPTGLVPKKKVSLRDFPGASAMLMPWDSSSRNVAIHGISGHELPEPVITHGGHDFARDEEHVRQGIIGASGDEISKRIATREAIARMENQKAGGTGQILHLPSTMGDYAEGFANTPAELAYQLHKRANLHPAESEELANIIRNTNAKTGPFRGFVGFTDPVAYAHQIRTGAGLANPAKAGELRKAINMKIIHGKRAQQLMGFNAEDVQNAMLDPALRGVPKGFFGNAVMSSDPEHMTLTPSQSNRDPYNTRFSGKYEGTLGQNLPFGALFGSKIPKLEQEFEYKKRKEGMHGPLQLNTGDMRNMVIGALEKRNPRVSQILDNKTLDQLDEFMRRRDQWMKTGHYAAGGKVEPDLDEMRLANTLRKPKKKALDIRSVGVDEAPDMAVKTYISPGLGKATTLPIGGVDFAPMMPGQQLAPGAGTPGQPQPPQQGGPGGPGEAPPAGPPGSPPIVPMGGPAPGEAPVGQSAQTPQSNILAMTRQGQALRALSPVFPPPMKKAAGGAVGSRNFQDGGEVGYQGEHGAPEPAGDVRGSGRRSAIALPDFYNKGGSVEQMSAELREKGKQNDFFPEDFSSRKTRVAPGQGNLDSVGHPITGTHQGLQKFWNWFGGSHAVDKANKPLRLYHSTNSDVSTFKANQPSSNNYGFLGNVPVTRAATFLTPNRKFSQEYLRESEGQNVMPVHAAIKKPFDMRKGLTDKQWDELEKAGVNPRAVHNTTPWELFDNDDNNQNHFVDTLKRLGYDSAIFHEDSPNDVSGTQTTYATFHPHQIKSAIGNRGTYDPRDPDITKKDGGSVEQMSAEMREKGKQKFLEPSHVKERLYHATPANFSEFKPGGNDPKISGHATWLSTDPHKQPAFHNIGSRSEKFREGTNVMPVHAQVKRPLMLDDPTMLGWAQDVFAGGSKQFPHLMPKEWADAVKDAGYDSVVHADPYKRGETHEIVMLHPNQIKSAIGNRGTYDTSSPDITKKDGGSVEHMSAELREKGRQKFLEPSAVKDVMYHGSMHDIQQFKPGGKGLLGPGIYLTPSAKLASSYANFRRNPAHAANTGGANVMPVHVQIKNPHYYDEEPYFPEEHQKQLQAAGHDASILRHRDGTISQINVFHPHQIKSAIGNRGTYDPVNPDITKKDGGSVEQMSAELREKGKQKFLEPSAVKDVMYHGTNKDITSFDPAKSHRHTAWFTGDPEHANKFVAGGRRNMGAKATKGSAVYPVHLSIKNPLNLTKFPPGTLLTMPELLAHAGLPNDQDALRSIAAQALSSRYAGVGSHIADPVSHIAEGYSRPARVNDMLDNPALINAFKAAGYDGLQQVEDNAKTYATFHPTQVKSATGNRGTYDPRDPDITKKSGGKVTLPASKEQMERELKRASHFKQKV